MALSDHDAVFIWGVGREGLAALEFLIRTAPGLEIILVDAREPKGLPGGVTWVQEDALPKAVAQRDNPLLVKSPGVSLYDERLDAALAAGAKLTSQTNLYFEHKPADQQVIAITGTKGKSTTSALLHHMLNALGENAVLAGNIGVPVLTAPREADWVVLELSSYQIADLVHAPDAFIFLNLANDHAPWHRGVERYRADKTRLARLDPNVPGVMNARDPRLQELFGHQPNRIWFGDEDSFHALGNEIWRGPDLLGPVANLPGTHNAVNACAALEMVEFLGLDVEQAFDSLEHFNGLPHRLQTVHEADQLRYVVDGLATTPEASINAVAAFVGTPLALILGGEDRDQDYDWLREALEPFDHIRAVLCLADNGETIVEALKPGRHGTVTRFTPDITEAVDAAREALPEGGVVLLSPAAPRGKAYTSYVDRGAAFKAAAKAGSA